MQQHTIKVFQKTSEVALLRFLSPDGALIGERELSLSDIERFAAEVEGKYRVLSYDPRATLPALGRELYEWLDGPITRWLDGALCNSEGMTLRIDVADRLRHLPWELLYTDTGYLCFNAHQLFTPVRLVTETTRKIEIYNRPLRTLFMACSAEDVQPLLDFETEEGMILESARRHQIELFVEESGSLDGLRYQVEAFGRGYFDVFHLTGHATVGKKGPRFLMEDNQGLRQDVSAEEIAEAFQGNWPRLVFLSGCRTGQSPEQGYLPSFCEALVRAGAPAVLGWALPVFDVTANLAAGELYGHLAAGKSIDEAVARTRLHLLREGSPDWHLLLLYVNATPLDGMVTALKTPKRARLQIREAASEFLDAGAKVEVCKREDFVGRRRSIQRCLRALQSREGEEQYAEGVLLHGMGGLGKSSLAARLCERMLGYDRIVFVGALDELGFIGKISSRLNDPEAIALFNQPGLNLTQRLRNLLAGPLSVRPVLFVLDDFEQNLEASGGGYIARSVPLEIMKSLLTAIRETSSESRVIVTTRYKFPLPSPLKLREEGLESLRGGELEKKLTRLKAFDPSAAIEEKTIERARALGAGNLRLLEWLDKILVDGTTDATPIMDAMEQEADRFRETVLLRELLSQLTVECRRMIALASIYELPFDRQSFAVAVDGPLDPHLERAVSLGLVEGGTNPTTGESRYFVSRLTLPLIEKETTEEDRTEAVRRAANYLYQSRWQAGTGVGTEEALELFRLAMAAEEQGIVAKVGSEIARTWVNSNRYREAEALCQTALILGEDHRLFLDLARAQVILGKTIEAEQNYGRALSLCPDSDVREKAGIIYNLATLVAQQGDVKRAIELWQESLALKEQIDDLQGKAATLNGMAWVIARQGDVKQALELWQESLLLNDRIGDVHGRATTLSNMAGVIAQQGDINRAIGLWQESLMLKEQIDDVRGRAVTLSNIAGVIAQQGDIKRALEIWQESLTLKERIGDVQGKAATLSDMAGVIARQGDIKRALELWQESLALNERIGDVHGRAVMLNNMASMIAWQGDIKRALELWQESLNLIGQIGDVQGKAATLSNMAGVIARQGDIKRALDLWQESLAHYEQIGDVSGRATTLNNMAGVIARQGDIKRAIELLQESLALMEQIGDVQGRAATLNNMGWLASEKEDFDEARRLYIEAGKSTVTVRSWLDLITILSNLANLPIEGALGFLAQAAWLAIQVESPAKETLNVIAALLDKLGIEHETAPLLGAAASFIAYVRGQHHPEQERLIEGSVNMLVACAAVRRIKQEAQFEQWLTINGLKDPERVLPALLSALEAMVSEEEWLFDRKQFEG
jgi:tetratricopeptide (TPR) repeat protein/CHAT domain-containing protein